jgi:hypothetical protein
MQDEIDPLLNMMLERAADKCLHNEIRRLTSQNFDQLAVAMIE